MSPRPDPSSTRPELRANAAEDRPAVSPRPNTCIVHVGMPKTGTTSIQESMVTGLADPKFHYMGLGYSNAIVYLAPVFGVTEQTFFYNQLAYSSDRIQRLARGYEARFRRALQSAAAQDRCPIISAEFLWHQQRSFFENFRDFLAAEGFSARIIAYVRPIKSYIESSMQQNVKAVSCCIQTLTKVCGQSLTMLLEVSG